MLEEAGGGPLPKRLSRRRVMVAAAVVWLVLSGWSLTRTANHADRATVLAQQALSGGDLSLDESLIELEAEVDAARSQLRRPWMYPLRFVPLVRSQVLAVEDTIDAAASAASTAGGALQDLRDAQDLPTLSHRLAATADAIGDARADLRSLTLTRGRMLLPQIGAAQDAFVTDVQELDATLARAQHFTLAVAGLLEGRTLLVMPNNAEMGAGSGMWLAAGVLESDGAGFDVDGITWASHILAWGSFTVVDEDYQALWWNLNPGRSLQYATLTPRTNVAAEIAAAMWNAEQELAGVGDVLVVDPVALEAIAQLGGRGAIETSAGPIAVDKVAEYLLVDQYSTGLGNAERREQSAVIAGEFLDTLTDVSADPFDLLDTFDRLVAEGHLMAWSADPSRQAHWEALGMAGLMTERSLMFSLLNPGGNKLDAFLGVEAVLDCSDDPAARCRLSAFVSNDATGDEVAAISGPERDLGPSHVVHLATAHLPGESTDVSLTIDGQLVEVLTGPDGPSLLIAGALDLAPGENSTVVVEFTLPAEMTSITIEPSARWPSIDWTVNGTSIPDARREIDLA